MAKDTDKLIRQLSLISYLMAERRPVTASEIRQNVEGYSGMNEDAFARRFYADRSELEALGIELRVDRPGTGSSASESRWPGTAEQESYSLPPENFFLAPVAFDDSELAALSTALHLLDGRFAYAEPLRLALQQISWGRTNPLTAPEHRTVALGITAEAGGHELSQRLSKIETATFRRKTITFDYYTMERDEEGERRVDPYQLLFQAGQFYLVGHSHERGAVRVFRLSRMRGKVAYATKAEHDFQRPEDFDPREHARRIPWQFGDHRGSAEIFVADRRAWQVERHFGAYGTVEQAGGGVVFTTDYASPRQVVSWVLGLGEHAHVIGPDELVREYDERVALLGERHAAGGLELAPVAEPVVVAEEPEEETENGRPRRRRARPVADPADSAIRPERFARLVALAAILIDAGRRNERPLASEVCERLQVSDQELREDISVLNVVNFGAGSYVLYAEVAADGRIEADPDAYSDSFARPARLLPVEAKALVSAIDLIGDHVPEGALASARRKVVAALGRDPVEEGLQVVQPAGDDPEVAAVVTRAISSRHMLRFEYYKENEDEFSDREVEPYALKNGVEGWYVVSFDPGADDVRHFRLDRVKHAEVSEEAYEPRPEIDAAADIDPWLRTGEVPAGRRARVWVSSERARWAREERTVVEDRQDGSVVVELGYAGTDWLVREVLKEAGDAAVLEPADARAAVRGAVGRLPQAAARA